MNIALYQKSGLMLNKAGTVAGGSYLYKVSGLSANDTVEDALAAVRTEAPETIGTAHRTTTTLESADAGLHPSQLTVRVDYKTSSYATKSEQDASFAFEIAGQTKHITRSLQTLGNYAPSGVTVPNYNSAIGVNENFEIEGCDIYAPQASFTETYYKSNSSVSSSYKKSLAGLVGKVNNAGFRGYEAGEVLFIGASGQRSGDDSEDKWQITYRYLVNFNQASATVGGISVGAVGGWEYVWARFKQAIVNGVKTMIAQSAHKEKVYESASFAILQ